MPSAAQHYSITEIELCRLATIKASYVHLLKKVDIDVVVDHLALMHIMKSKTELATKRIKRLLEILSSYTFNIYYLRSKGMIPSDFLSQMEGDEGDHHEVIPIPFNFHSILRDH